MELPMSEVGTRGSLAGEEASSKGSGGSSLSGVRSLTTSLACSSDSTSSFSVLSIWVDIQLYREIHSHNLKLLCLKTKLELQGGPSGWGPGVGTLAFLGVQLSA